MLEWKIKNGDDKLKKGIQRTKETFDEWFKNYWWGQCTREEMLGENSPIQHVYYKMTKTFDEVKEKYPEDALEMCSCCGRYVDRWIETEFSFCNEYGCGMSLCKKCANELKEVIERL